MLDIPSNKLRLRHWLGTLFREILAVLPVETSVQTIVVSDTTQEVSLEAYHTKFITSHASSVCSLADGEIIGQRKLLTLLTQGTGGDEVALDETNVHNASGTQATSVTFDAEGEYLLLEWTGAEWQAVYTTATIGTA